MLHRFAISICIAPLLKKEWHIFNLAFIINRNTKSLSLISLWKVSLIEFTKILLPLGYFFLSKISFKHSLWNTTLSQQSHSKFCPSIVSYSYYCTSIKSRPFVDSRLALLEKKRLISLNLACASSSLWNEVVK